MTTWETIKRAASATFSALESSLKIPQALIVRTAQPFGLLLLVFVAGTLGFWLIGQYNHQAWSLVDCAFMTSITLTTVGYGDSLGVTELPLGKVYVMFLIVTGMGATLYSVSALTAFFVEGYLGTLFREARLERKIKSLHGHTVICGSGATGIHVIEEHVASGEPFVVIDRDAEHITHAQAVHGAFSALLGDANDEEVLKRAGIDRAGKLVAVLGEDKDNLFLVVTARYLRPDLSIVAKCNEHESVGKFEAAGASHVVSPTYIGGLRIASQALRPHVVDFMDTMLRSADGARVAECSIEPGSTLAGKQIAQSRIGERVGLLVVAMRMPGDKDFIYSPSRTTELVPGSVIVVIGPLDKIAILEDMARSKASYLAPA